MPLFGFKSRAERRDTDAPMQPQVLYLQGGMAVGLIQWSASIAAKEAMKHPIVYRAVDKLAASVQRVPWKVEVDKEAAAADQLNKETARKRILETLNSPNDNITHRNLRYWMGLNFALYGRVPFSVGVGKVSKLPSGIYPLTADQTRVHMNARGVVDSYVYGTGESEQTYDSLVNRKEGKKFAHQIWRPGLKGFPDRDDANTPLDAIGLPALVHKHLLIRAFETATGHPNVRYVISCSKTLTPEQMKALKNTLNREGVENLAGSTDKPGGIPVIQHAGGAEFQIHELKQDLSDIHSKTPTDDMSRLIFGAYGIPIALAGIGAADAAKFAGNYIESRAAFWEDTVLPVYVDPLFAGLTQALCPPGLVILPDLEQVPAVADIRARRMKEVDGSTFLTINEKRAMFGLVERPDGNVYAPAPPPTTGAGNEGNTNA
jgi:hypothetical protein